MKIYLDFGEMKIAVNEYVKRKYKKEAITTQISLNSHAVVEVFD